MQEKETKVGVGKSSQSQGFEAGVEATRLALDQAGVKDCDFIFVFATVGYEQKDLLKGISSVSSAPLIGCSMEGIITHEGSDESQRRVAVMVISSSAIKFTTAVAVGLKKDSLAAGQEIAEKLNTVWPEDAKALIMLPDGLAVNTDAFFRGLEDNLEESIPFVGGTAGETLAFKQTFQYYHGEVLEDAAPCVLLSGDFNFEVGISHGSQPMGIEKTVTKAKGNHVFKIDDKPAFEIFREFLGSDINDLDGPVVSGVCLGVETPKEAKESYENVILRIPLALNKKDDSLFMTVEWSEGQKILVCQRNPEQIIQKARKVAEELKSKLGSHKPKLVLQFNCAGRGGYLIGAEKAKQETIVNQKPFGKEVPWLGGYTFGEIAPIGKKNYFHNWTNALFIIY